MIAAGFPPQPEMARLTARMLLEIDAVLLRPDDPFTFTSGLVSPVYVDCRKLIAFPRIRATLMDFAVATLAREAGFERFDVVAGGETAGIPFAAWIADRLGLPMAYVRKKPKGFGRNARIEGAVAEGDRALLVEDLATDGGSKRSFAEGLRGAGAECAHSFVVFYYDIFPDAPAQLEQAGLRLHWLATWWDVLTAASETGRLDARARAQVEAFLRAPLEWSAEHGGKATR
jgi:orotate phosphoribosyltransferase